MHRSLEEYIDSTARATTLHDVGVMLKKALAAEGFDTVGFLQFRHGVPSGTVWDDLPHRFLAAYCEQRWDRVDPYLKVARDSHGAFGWSAVDPPENGSAGQLSFYSELRARGLFRGAVVPLRGPRGQFDICGMTSVGRSQLTASVLGRVYALVVQAWLRHADLAEGGKPPTFKLSRREIECLKWLKDGKTNWEIGEILRISEKTVEFHVGNVMRKLGVDSRVAAVVSAIRRGVIDL